MTLVPFCMSLTLDLFPSICLTLSLSLLLFALYMLYKVVHPDSDNLVSAHGCALSVPWANPGVIRDCINITTRPGTPLIYRPRSSALLLTLPKLSRSHFIFFLILLIVAAMPHLAFVPFARLNSHHAASSATRTNSKRSRKHERETEYETLCPLNLCDHRCNSAIV